MQMKMISSLQMDLEEFAASETFAGICKNQELMNTYPDEGCPQVIEHWLANMGLKYSS